MKQYNKTSETLYLNLKPEELGWDEKIQALRKRKICIFCGTRKATSPSYVLCKECTDEHDYK